MLKCILLRICMLSVNIKELLLEMASPYHEGIFKIVTIKGALFGSHSQAL